MAICIEILENSHDSPNLHSSIDLASISQQSSSSVNITWQLYFTKQKTTLFLTMGKIFSWAPKKDKGKNVAFSKGWSQQKNENLLLHLEQSVGGRGSHKFQEAFNKFQLRKKLLRKVSDELSCKRPLGYSLLLENNWGPVNAHLFCGITACSKNRFSV